LAADRDRAYALSPLSGQIFQAIGMWSDIFPHIGKYRQIHLSDGDYFVGGLWSEINNQQSIKSTIN
jgi:2-polyprenyl-6-methoxyphenol hydroxylase-like FAD-dependent oxidoreductase